MRRPQYRALDLTATVNLTDGPLTTAAAGWTRWDSLGTRNRQRRDRHARHGNPCRVRRTGGRPSPPWNDTVSNAAEIAGVAAGAPVGQSQHVLV